MCGTESRSRRRRDEVRRCPLARSADKTIIRRLRGAEIVSFAGTQCADETQHASTDDAAVTTGVARVDISDAPPVVTAEAERRISESPTLTACFGAGYRRVMEASVAVLAEFSGE